MRRICNIFNSTKHLHICRFLILELLCWNTRRFLRTGLHPVKAGPNCPPKKAGHVYSNNSGVSSLTLNLKAQSDKGQNLLEICRFTQNNRIILSPANGNFRRRNFFTLMIFSAVVFVFDFYLLNYWSDCNDIFWGRRYCVSPPREIFWQR